MTDKLGLVALLVILWLVVGGGELSSWVVGVPGVIIVAALLIRSGHRRLSPVRLWPLGVFIVFFVVGSLAGGLDVARRVVRLQVTITPRTCVYRWRLNDIGLRQLAIATLCLQPGTLAVADRGSELHIHCLDGDADIDAAMRRIENKVAALVGLKLR